MLTGFQQNQIDRNIKKMYHIMVINLIIIFTGGAFKS